MHLKYVWNELEIGEHEPKFVAVVFMSNTFYFICTDYSNNCV